MVVEKPIINTNTVAVHVSIDRIKDIFKPKGDSYYSLDQQNEKSLSDLSPNFCNPHAPMGQKLPLYLHLFNKYSNFESGEAEVDLENSSISRVTNPVGHDPDSNGRAEFVHGDFGDLKALIYFVDKFLEEGIYNAAASPEEAAKIKSKAETLFVKLKDVLGETDKKDF